MWSAWACELVHCGYLHVSVCRLWPVSVRFRVYRCGYITLGKVVLDLPPSLMLQPQGRAISLSGRAGMAGGLRGQESFWRTFYRNQGSMSSPPPLAKEGAGWAQGHLGPSVCFRGPSASPRVGPLGNRSQAQVLPQLGSVLAGLGRTGRGEAPRCWGVGWGLPCLGHIQSVKGEEVETTRS